jgi:hypothetical protein
MELAKLEPATSWVRCGKALTYIGAHLQGVPLDSPLSPGLVCGSVCRDLSGFWSGRTSGGATLGGAPLSSELDRFEEVNGRS